MPSSDMLVYIRERLQKVDEDANSALSRSQGTMKSKLDKKSMQRDFQVGDEVLVLLPVSGFSLQAKFSSPYIIDKKWGETDYADATPDRGRKTPVCYMNMVKPYVMRHESAAPYFADFSLVKQGKDNAGFVCYFGLGSTLL